ncbi:uricase [Cladophialophora carrionii CBS 160.54]|uniref:Uricase n=1 Tax=Cladophialophora carrionii CBS 160.54 TaxID=1279043 RepID=V9D7E8_9EURO|nr:uricase [Cladophialophora carrionii CBS 160.54]ETI22805.1 uricase [Cladophialophora carrionii CBS 160.54]
MPRLAAARYGKDNIRLYKVERDEATKTHTVYEMTVCVLLEGEIDVSYTKADNSVVVATDTMKNTTYIMAKQNPVHPPELFASILGTHFIQTYKHIHTAHISIIQHRWTRMTIDGKPHPHSFFRDSSEKRLVQADVVEGKGIELKSGISDLLVLKSTGSQFHSFVRNDFTTLPEVWDRILSTSVDANWNWSTFSSLEAVKKNVVKFDETWSKAREITFRLFALEESPSVQNTMYKMCEQILAAQPLLQTVDYSLPNKHYFEIDLSWHHGLKNTGKDAEVYAPQSDPNGLIKCTVARDELVPSAKL